MQINILEAKNRLSQLIKSAQAGEDVVIANRGAPVARLVATSADQAGVAVQTGRARDILEWLAKHPLPAYARRTAGQIDAGIAGERAGWE